MNDTTLRNRLSALDAAPGGPLTHSELTRRDALLTAVLATADRLPAPVPARPQPRTRVRMFGVVAGASAAGLIAAALVVGPHLLSHGGSETATSGITSVQLSSWTGAPAPLDQNSATGSAAAAWCLSATAAGPGSGSQTLQNADLRGQVASMVVLRGGNASYCMTAGTNDGFWELLTDAGDQPATVAAGDITIESDGSHGDGNTGFDYVEGLSGTDIAAVSIHNGTQTVSATVEDGRWTAWWPNSHPDGNIGGTITLTATDGSSRSMPVSSLIG
ncbi:MAG: hypothetical protein ABJA11_10215 [Pseudolysinimonas sp.]